MCCHASFESAFVLACTAVSSVQESCLAPCEAALAPHRQYVQHQGWTLQRQGHIANLSCLSFSLYKTWGPHLAALYGSHSAFNEIKVSCLWNHVSGKSAQQKSCTGELPMCCSSRMHDSMPRMCMAGGTRDKPPSFLLFLHCEPPCCPLSFLPALQPTLLGPLRPPA